MTMMIENGMAILIKNSRMISLRCRNTYNVFTDDCSFSHCGRLAQLVRAFDSHSKGPRFEPGIVHHDIDITIK